MREFVSDVAFTPTVKAIQKTLGSRQMIAKAEERGCFETKVTPALASFIKTLDMFYFGTSNEEGQPYIQYKGGARGFLRVIDDKTLGWADFSGNRQFISSGNLLANDRAFIFLMDYTLGKRVKVWGRAKVEDSDEALLESLYDSDYHGQVERAIVFTVEAWDTNCSQHIHTRYSKEEVAPIVDQLNSTIDGLKARLAKFETDAASSR